MCLICKIPLFTPLRAEKTFGWKIAAVGGFVKNNSFCSLLHWMVPKPVNIVPVSFYISFSVRFADAFGLISGVECIDADIFRSLAGIWKEFPKPIVFWSLGLDFDFVTRNKGGFARLMKSEKVRFIRMFFRWDFSRRRLLMKRIQRIRTGPGK